MVALSEGITTKDCPNEGLVNHESLGWPRKEIGFSSV